MNTGFKWYTKDGDIRPLSDEVFANLGGAASGYVLLNQGTQDTMNAAITYPAWQSLNGNGLSSFLKQVPTYAAMILLTATGRFLVHVLADESPGNAGLGAGGTNPSTVYIHTPQKNFQQIAILDAA